MKYTNQFKIMYKKQKNGADYAPELTKYTRLMRLMIFAMIMGMSSLLAVSGYAQSNKTIKGKVTDSKGLSIPGVSVILKGTTTGIITDIEGDYTLSLPADAKILKFTFIGMTTQEIAIGTNATINVVLADESIGIDEVVVVGFGTQKKVNLTGSVGTVDSDALSARPVMTAAQALQGMVAGLNISQSNGSMEDRASINIRGVGTIDKGSSSSPLILIDGLEGDINVINPQDIENISVLKDAAASSIYGSRAAFGVILVTTKKGKTGKATVNYNNSFRWNSPVVMPQMMDSYTFALYFNDASINGGMAPHFNAESLQRIQDYQSGKITSSTIADPNNPTRWADGYASGNDNIDWYKALYRSTTMSQEHNLSVNGGSEKVNYYLSMNYLDQNGMMKYNQDMYDRYAGTAKINIKITDWATLNYSSRFIREDYGRPSSLTSGLYSDIGRQGWPTLPLNDPNGNLLSSPSPALALRDGGRDKTQTDNLYQQVQVVLEPVKGWKTTADFNYRIKSANRHWDSQKTYNHAVDGTPYLYKTSSNVHEDYLKENYMNMNLFSEYSYGTESGHNMKAMVGFQSEMMKKTAFGLQREGIILPDYPSVDITSGVDNNGDLVVPSVNGEYAHWSTVGFFGRLNYDYKGRYLAEVNLRYDGASRFRAAERWKLFPSYSAGWNIAHEEFWEPLVDYMGTFKLRASYGELGNQNTTSWYPTYQTMAVSASDGQDSNEWLMNGNWPATAKAPGLVSSTLTWERINTWNVGVDFGSFSNRLTGSFDYYNRYTLDMVGPAPELPLTLGTDVPKTNNTDLKTAGWELSVGWNDKTDNGFGYAAKLLVSDSRTEITRYPNLTGSLDSKTYRAGEMLGEIWGYTSIGIAKTQEEMDAHLSTLTNGGQDALGNRWEAGDIMFEDVNGDGKIDNGANTINDHGDLKIIGNSTPRFQFGLDLNADYKGFDARIFLQGTLKRDYFQGSYFFWGATSNKWWSTGMTVHEDYFRADVNSPLGQNLNSYYPRPDFSSGKNQQTQTRYLQNAAFARLKNIQLGYTLPAELTRKVGISKFRMFVSGENLLTATDLIKVFDPETISGGWESSGSVYPLSKTISVGLNINF